MRVMPHASRFTFYVEIYTMRRYIARRLLLLIPGLLAVYTLTFIVMHATPGGPWDMEDKPLFPEVIENLNRKYHLDD
ncbi:MAG: hypothetical protein HY258_10805, partial [Chloroflexi bacterium]|nr:hypothetical protein [Chloroflexota bacterium]